MPIRFRDHAVDGHARDTQRPGRGGGSLTGGDEVQYTFPIDARLPSRVDARLLRLGNALGLAIPPDIGLELGEHGQHAEEGPASRCRCIDALLDHPEMGPGAIDLVRDVGEVPQGPAEPIQPRDDQRVALGQHLQCKVQLLAAGTFGTRTLLLENDPTPVPLQGFLLDGKVLVLGTDAGVPDLACHVGDPLSQLAVLVTYCVTSRENQPCCDGESRVLGMYWESIRWSDTYFGSPRCSPCAIPIVIAGPESHWARQEHQQAETDQGQSGRHSRARWALAPASEM